MEQAITEDSDYPSRQPDLMPLRIKSDLPEIHIAQCKVCTCDYRHAIERQIAMGTSYREIERIFGDTISRKSIANHAKLHLSYEQAAIAKIIEQQGVAAQQNHEDGVSGRLLMYSYLSVGIKRAFTDLVEGNAHVPAPVAIQMIQMMDKFDHDAQGTAILELELQFQAFMEAVKRTVPHDMWDAISAETATLTSQARSIDSTALPMGE